MDKESSSSLLSRESETLLDLEHVDEEEYVVNLMQREIKFLLKKDESLVYIDEVKSARLESISWILKTGAALGFRNSTPYVAMTYFDRYLLKNTINDKEKLWTIRLLSVASLRIAAKIEEYTIPSVTHFQFEDVNFGNQAIQRMELLLMTTLEWRLSSVTPFAFLDYFITRLCQESPPTDIHSRISGLIFATMKVINVVEHRPSAIAAGATLVALDLDHKLTKAELELKMDPISHIESLKFEDVFQYYNLMQELKSNQEELDLSSPRIDSMPEDVPGTSSLTKDLHSGSKRLPSTDSSDQNYGEKRLRIE